MDNNASVEKFLKDLEDKRGGHIEWRTIALFYGDSNRVFKSSLFLYKIGDTFYFEDFEKEHTVLGFKVNPPKNYKYVKFEGSFKIDDVKSVERIITSSARKYCEGKRNGFKKAGKLASKLTQTALKIELGKDEFVIMEMLREQEFVQLINKR